MAKKLSTQELQALARPHFSEVVTEVVATSDGCIFLPKNAGQARAWANRNNLTVHEIKASDLEGSKDEDKTPGDNKKKKKGDK